MVKKTGVLVQLSAFEVPHCRVQYSQTTRVFYNGRFMYMPRVEGVTVGQRGPGNGCAQTEYATPSEISKSFLLFLDDYRLPTVVFTAIYLTTDVTVKTTLSAFLYNGINCVTIRIVL